MLTMVIELMSGMGTAACWQRRPTASRGTAAAHDLFSDQVRLHDSCSDLSDELKLDAKESRCNHHENCEMR